MGNTQYDTLNCWYSCSQGRRTSVLAVLFILCVMTTFSSLIKLGQKALLIKHVSSLSSRYDLLCFSDMNSDRYALFLIRWYEAFRIGRICFLFVVWLDSVRWLPIECQYFKKWQTPAVLCRCQVQMPLFYYCFTYKD